MAGANRRGGPTRPAEEEDPPVGSRAGTPADSRLLRVVRPLPVGFPNPPTELIGRERELSDIGELLGRTRLLTLTGMGGAGKTRLAIESARRALDAFPDGVAWVELAALRDGALLPQAIAAVMQVNPRAGSDVLDALGDHLRSQRCLLVLDNCEHLVGACAMVVQRLLATALELKILVTSREPLRLSGEVTWRVPPLSLPEEEDDLARLGEREAVRLFVERARAVDPHFTLKVENATHIGAICRRVDGIPLAIELAAARVRLLTPGQIAARLDDCFHLLASGGRDSEPRQRTLRATLDWSYDLLSEEQRQLFSRVAIFAGGFALEAVEAVCPGEGLAADEVLEGLGGLVEKSLVVVEEARGEARYRLLEPVRQYAAELLRSPPEAGALPRRHAGYFLQLAETLEPRLTSAGQAGAVERLEVEHDDLRSAMRYFLEQRDAGSATRLGASLWRFWQTRGYLTEGRQWLGSALELPCPVAADSHADRAARAARARALQGAGVLAWAQGEYAEARRDFEESLDLFDQLADLEGTAALQNNLGVIALHLGEYGRATGLFEASLQGRRVLGNRLGVATVLNNLGATAGKQGDPARAFRYYEESLAIQREVGYTQGVAVSVTNLGASAYDQGDLTLARKHFQEALELRRLLGDRAGVADSLLKLGRVALRSGDVEQARADYAAGAELLRRLGDRERIANVLMGAAVISGQAGDETRALRLLGAADALRQAMGAPLTAEERTERDELLDMLRARLNGVAVEALRAEGSALGWEEALDLAALVVPVTSECQRLVEPAGQGDANPGAGTAAVRTTDSVGQQGEVGAHPTTELRIRGLGALEVSHGEERIQAAAWGSAKPRELLFYLLAHPDGRTKEQIGVALWPEASPAQLRNSFHVTLHHLRRALGEPEWIVFEDDRYRFNRELPYRYDVETFGSRLSQAESLSRGDCADAREIANALQGAIDLYRGDFLEETVFGEWHLEIQDELRRAFLDAILRLADHLLDDADYPKAAAAYRHALSRDRLLEAAHRGLMIALARGGEPDRALAHNTLLEGLFREELDASPGPETRRLIERLRRGEPV